MAFTLHPGWPITTPTVMSRGYATQRDDSPGKRVRIRPLTRSDGTLWRRLRIDDQKYLQPVEPTIKGDWAQAHSKDTWRRTYSGLKKLARSGIVVPGVIEVDGEFAGQLTLGTIQHGAIASAWIGYWVHSDYTGHGVAVAAVALGVDHAMGQVGLHRLEATVMENNMASRVVLERTGFRQEGLLQRNLHINGRWTDHILVVQTKEEIPPGGKVRELINAGILGIASRR